MTIVGYTRGADAERQSALLNEYAKKRGLKLEEIYIDRPGEYGAFRALQNAVKYGLCGAVLLPSYDSLADDRYLMLENKLFLDRNGVMTLFIEKGGADARHGIVLGISRYFSHITDMDSAYGVSLPLRNTFCVFRRTPPFGYDVKEGNVVINKREAQAVREIFALYASGAQLKDIYYSINEKYGFEDKLGNMTVKTILKNERYLGRMSKKGYHLPPIISYNEWLAVKERLEREYGTVRENEPFISVSYSDVPIVFYRGEAGRESAHRTNRDPDCVFIDSDAFEKELCGIIASLAAPANAEAFYSDHIVRERNRTSVALPKAEAALGRINKAVYNDIARIKSGDSSEEIQARLEKNNSSRVFFAMRIRRIRSEAALYSGKMEQVAAFFERAGKMVGLSTEENRFIAETFISSVTLRGGRIRLSIRDPLSPKRRIVHIDSCIE